MKPYDTGLPLGAPRPVIYTVVRVSTYSDGGDAILYSSHGTREKAIEALLKEIDVYISSNRESLVAFGFYEEDLDYDREEVKQTGIFHIHNEGDYEYDMAEEFRVYETRLED